MSSISSNSADSEELSSDSFYAVLKDQILQDEFDIDCTGKGGCTLSPATGNQYFSTEEAYLAASEVPEDNRWTHIQEEHEIADFERSKDWANTELDLLIRETTDYTITVSVQLEEVPSNLAELQAASGEARTAWIDDRKEALEPIQQEFTQFVESIGGEVHFNFWLTNAVIAEVPTSALQEIRSQENVTGVFPTDGKSENLIHFDGDSARVGTRATEIIADGFKGQNNNLETGGPIRLGIIELGQQLVCYMTNWTGHLQHAGTCDPDCDSPGSVHSDTCTWTTSLADETYHGTAVTWAAAGGIEDGQHGSFPGSGTLEQRKRSGTGQEMDIYYIQAERPTFSTSHSCSVASGIENLLEQGVDVFNMSFALTTLFGNKGQCQSGVNLCSLNQIISNAYSAGAIPVASSGNYGEQGGTCNVTYPANRYHVVSVGSLQAHRNAYDYRSSIRSSPSSYGRFIDSYRGTGNTAYVPLVDVMAPGRFTHWPWSASQYNTGDILSGTSLASPQVAAALGLVRQWRTQAGSGNVDQTGRIMNHALLFGDGFTGDGSDPDRYNRYT